MWATTLKMAKTKRATTNQKEHTRGVGKNSHSKGPHSHENLSRSVSKAINYLVSVNKGFSSMNDVEKYLIAEKKMKKVDHDKLKEIIKVLFQEKKIVPQKQPTPPVTAKFILNHTHSLSVHDHDSSTDNERRENYHINESQIPSTSKDNVPKMPSKSGHKPKGRPKRPSYVLPTVRMERAASQSDQSTEL